MCVERRVTDGCRVAVRPRSEATGMDHRMRSSIVAGMGAEMLAGTAAAAEVVVIAEVPMVGEPVVAVASAMCPVMVEAAILIVIEMTECLPRMPVGLMSEFADRLAKVP